MKSPIIVSIMPVDNTVICPSTNITVNADDNVAVKKLTLKYSQDNENWTDIATKINGGNNTLMRLIKKKQLSIT